MIFLLTSFTFSWSHFDTPTICESVVYSEFPPLLLIGENYYFLVLLGRFLYIHYWYSGSFYCTRSCGFYSLALREAFHVKNMVFLLFIFSVINIVLLELALLVVCLNCTGLESISLENIFWLFDNFSTKWYRDLCLACFVHFKWRKIKNSIWLSSILLILHSERLS